MNAAAAATAARWGQEEDQAEQEAEFQEFRRNKRAGQVAAAAPADDDEDKPHVPLNAPAAKQLATLGWELIDFVGQMALGPKFAIPEKKKTEFVDLSVPCVQLVVPEVEGADALMSPWVPLGFAVGSFYLSKWREPDAPASETIDAKAEQPKTVEASRPKPAPPRVVEPDDDEERDAPN